MKKIKAYGIVLYTVHKDSIKILLCKSVKSKNKWGALKGGMIDGEKPTQTAMREFYEESSISIHSKHFEKYFEQSNKKKDIGVWLVNTQEIHSLKPYFNEQTLKYHLLSWENSKAKFFDISQLPPIKSKQKVLIKAIVDFLRNRR